MVGSVTETFVPLITFVPVSFAQEMFVERAVLNWSVKPLNGAGHVTCTR